MLILAMRFPTRNWAGSIRRDPHRSGTVIHMTEQGPGTGDEGATILSFPTEQEAPRSREVDLEGEPVTVIYLPWRHEVDGADRPAGLYYRANDTSGFYPDPAVRGLDAVLDEARPWLQRHLRLIREPEEGPAGR